MRKRTIRSGMRILLAALLLIIVASFFHAGIADLLSLSMPAEQRFYRFGIFWGGAMGAYGVMLSTFGLILSATPRDDGVRILPLFLMILFGTIFFFYLFVVTLTAPFEERRLRPGSTITI